MGAIADRATLSELATVASPNPVDNLSKAQLAELQVALSLLGYPVGGIDGEIGPKTRNAWAEYKTDIFPGNPLLIGAESIDRLRQDLLKVAAWETSNFAGKQGTIDAIAGMCRTLGIVLPTQVAYVLATTQWETAQTFQPVKEAFWKDEAWREANFGYFPYYGRGYVQLTWDKNYKAYSDILGIDLVKDPDRAMDPAVALFVLVHGFKTGTFTGRKITDFITASMTDFIGARRCINGTDKADEIARLAETFLSAPAPAAAPAPMAVAPPAVAPPAVSPPVFALSFPPAAGGATDPAIEKLSLRPIARAAAYELKRLRPEVVFTSGRRDKAAQARAMAENCVGRTNWISETYASNKASQACQQWVWSNPQATGAQAIAAGLIATMNALSDTELGQMSRHLSGDAFDIQPIEPDTGHIKEAIRALPGLRIFLDREGGLVRWHAEFNG
ncbi:hypothetical protein BH10PSE6_BH10PSE6_38720 [soil metagenome]